MTEHEDAAAHAQQGADRLEERSDALGEQIEQTRDDWESRKADPGVPGAQGDADPSRARPGEGQDAAGTVAATGAADAEGEGFETQGNAHASNQPDEDPSADAPAGP